MTNAVGFTKPCEQRPFCHRPLSRLDSRSGDPAAIGGGKQTESQTGPEGALVGMGEAMITHDLPLYRPPSEADSVIIQATIGCSFNACGFCGMYKDKVYRARPLTDIARDIALAARSCPDARRVFLADGDALVLPTADLLAILEILQTTFASLRRVSAYATPINLRQKSIDELRELARAGLTLLYLGI